MEEFLLKHVERYQNLVGKLKPERIGKEPAETTSGKDVLVTARIRPLSEDEETTGFPSAIFLRPDTGGTVDAHELRRPIRGLPMLKSSAYQVDHAYGPESTTQQIYEDTVRHLVPWAWGGGISTLFAYGQTGSGKTFTVSGLEKLVAQQLMSQDSEGRKVYITIIELAGNSAHDLLNARRPISVLEDSFGVTQLAGALEKHVTTTQEILDHIEIATTFRRTEATARNDTSSRSHAICRIRIEIDSVSGAEDGMLYLVDLAGSEAARDRATHGADRMRETREINMSLSVLKDCIRGKTETDALLGVLSKKKPHIPFRQSALTKVLKHVFDPAGKRTCKTVVMACVNPCLADTSASRNTLRYAEMLRVFVPVIKAVQWNPASPMTWSNEQLQQWIDKSSGTPAISSSILAPTENGSQLLRLPGPEFHLRCLRTPNVTPEQANAFRSKLWQHHIDSQRAKAVDPNPAESAEPDTILAHLENNNRGSSRDTNPGASSLPFKERIRPGMVVSWIPPRRFHIGLSGKTRDMAIVFCPVDAVMVPMNDAGGRSVKHETESGGDRYLCAMVAPGMMADAYEVHMWRHIVLTTEMMEAEILLEYDQGTRYYYMAV